MFMQKLGEKSKVFLEETGGDVFVTIQKHYNHNDPASDFVRLTVVELENLITITSSNEFEEAVKQFGLEQIERLNSRMQTLEKEKAEMEHRISILRDEYT